MWAYAVAKKRDINVMYLYLYIYRERERERYTMDVRRRTQIFCGTAQRVAVGCSHQLVVNARIAHGSMWCWLFAGNNVRMFLHQFSIMIAWTAAPIPTQETATLFYLTWLFIKQHMMGTWKRQMASTKLTLTSW